MCVLVAQLYLTLCGPMDCSSSGSSGHGILQARILGWVAIPFPRGPLQPGIEPRSPESWASSLLPESPGKPAVGHWGYLSWFYCFSNLPLVNRQLESGDICLALYWGPNFHCPFWVAISIRVLRLSVHPEVAVNLTDT